MATLALRICKTGHPSVSVVTNCDSTEHESEVKTSTGSSFHHHFGKKKRFWGFFGFFNPVPFFAKFSKIYFSKTGGDFFAKFSGFVGPWHPHKKRS